MGVYLYSTGVHLYSKVHLYSVRSWGCTLCGEAPLHGSWLGWQPRAASGGVLSGPFASFPGHAVLEHRIVYPRNKHTYYTLKGHTSL